MKRRSLFLVLLAIATALTTVRFVISEQKNANQSLATRMEGITTVGNDQVKIPCRELAASHPLVLLALGQSNAGNHGTSSGARQSPIALFADGQCLMARDPLPGATGSGASIWQRLPELLEQRQPDLPIVVSVLAVDASTIDEWTAPDSPLRRALIAHVGEMVRSGLPPGLILWQQGEADANHGSSQESYFTQLALLSSTLTRAGSNAPIIVARSTLCRSAPSASIRKAIETMISANGRFRPGPDTDALSGTSLRNGCHFTEDGLASAARLWAQAIDAELSRAGPVPH